MRIPLGVTATIFTLTLFTTSCATRSKSEAQRFELSYLEDFFDGYGCVVLHHQIYATGKLARNVTAPAAVAAIRAYLQGMPGAPRARYCSHLVAGPAKVYWALQFSALTHGGLDIRTYDTEFEREEATNIFLSQSLQSVKGSGK